MGVDPPALDLMGRKQDFLNSNSWMALRGLLRGRNHPPFLTRRTAAWSLPGGSLEDPRADPLAAFQDKGKPM